MGDKKKIVMIDDEPDLCLLVKESLEETGVFEVLTAVHAQEGENLIRQEKPDLILLDNIMPTKKGSEIVKDLKKDEATKNIPIIMVSGKGEMVYSKKKNQFQWQPNNPSVKNQGELPDGKNASALSEAYGVDDYIAKPFTTELLVDVINEVMKRKCKELGEEKQDDMVI